MNILVALFPLVVLIAMGYFLKRSEFVSAEFWRGTERLNYFILFPILLFSNLAFVEIEFEQVRAALIAMICIIILCSLVLWGIRFFRYIPSARFGVYVQSNIRFNTYIGLSLMGPLYGPKAMQLFAMIMVLAIPLVNVISVFALSQGRGISLKQTLLMVLKNPLIWGCLVGIAYNVSGLPLYEGLTQTLKLLAATSLPLGLLCVGAGLQFAALGKALPRLTINTLTRLLLVPLTAYFICGFMHLNATETAALVVFFSLPTATAAYILTKILQGDSELMAGMISLQTICFALSFPFLLWLLAI